MQRISTHMIETEIHGCPVTLSFSEKPADHVLERIKAILSTAYEERVLTELRGGTGKKSTGE